MRLSVRSLALSVVLATASLGAVACGGSVEQPASANTATTKAAIGTNTHGFVKLVGEALGDVPLRAEQRTELEKLAGEAEARHAPLATGHKELSLALADQIEKGQIDKAALQPKIDKITADMTQSRDQDRAALVRMHGLLDSEQRNQFVDAFETRMKAKRGELHHGGPGGFGGMKHLADELKLTDDQKSKIHDAMKQGMNENLKDHKKGPHGFKGRHHEGKAVLEAFRADKLDLDKVAPPHEIHGDIGMMSGHMGQMAEKILPVLTPEQRKIAADKIREWANK